MKSSKGENTLFTRREFVKLTVGALATARAQAAMPLPEIRNGLPYRPLGRTGEKVSLVGLGGYHIGIQADENESIRIIRTALDNGINFLDNSWDYNAGASE